MKKFLFYTVLLAAVILGSQSCREAPTMPENTELDPTLDSFVLNTPDDVSASHNKQRGEVTIAWSDSLPVKPNNYQIMVISIDENLSQLDSIVTVVNPGRSGRYETSWTDKKTEGFIKKYTVRSAFEMDNESKYSEWSDTVSVNLFQFNTTIVPPEDESVNIELSYSIPTDSDIKYRLERMVEDETELISEENLDAERTFLRITDEPVLKDVFSFSYRIQLIINNVPQQWEYLDSVSVDPEYVGPPSRMAFGFNSIFEVTHIYADNWTHTINASLLDCNGTEFYSASRDRSYAFNANSVSECFPIEVRASSKYLMFESRERAVRIHKEKGDIRLVESPQRNFPEHDVDVRDIRESDNGEFMIGIGQDYVDDQFVIGRWKAGEDVLERYTKVDHTFADVIGYDSRKADGFYIMTTEEIHRYQNGTLTETKQHGFQDDISKIDWFYAAPDRQRFMLAVDGVLSYYDYLTLQPLSRPAVSYNKIRHLWDDLVLLQDDESVKVWDVISGEVILSWPQTTIVWHSGHEQAGLLLADGTVVRFLRDDLDPKSFQLTDEVDRFSVKGMLPVSDEDILFSTIKNNQTKVLFFSSGQNKLDEKMSRNFPLSGIHAGWLLDDKPSYYIEVEQFSYEIERDDVYNVEEIEE